MRERRNRLIRWLIIAVSLAFLFPACYPDPWTPEGAVSEALRGMSIPSDTVRAVSVFDTGGLYSVLFYDEQHRIYHHFFMDRPFGFLWRNRGGGLYAYDRSGTLLYRLDSDHPVIRRHAGGE